MPVSEDRIQQVLRLMGKPAGAPSRVLDLVAILAKGTRNLFFSRRMHLFFSAPTRVVNEESGVIFPEPICDVMGENVLRLELLFEHGAGCILANDSTVGPHSVVFEDDGETGYL